MGIPANSPYEAPRLICTTCGEYLYGPHVNRMNNGKVIDLTYFCEKCQYAWTPSSHYSNGQHRPITQEDKARLHPVVDTPYLAKYANEPAATQVSAEQTAKEEQATKA